MERKGSETMEDVCVCRNIEKAYGQPVLKGCSLHIPAGSIYGLIGENGAGKTTLIRILTGLQKPDAGTYSLFDVDASDKAIHLARKRMGAIVEMPALDPELDALSNVRAQARLLELEPGHEKEALEWVGLNDPGTKKAGDFSLGMRQRLGLAMALIGHPDFILLDEPTNGLDPQGMIELRELILKLNKEHRITFLISSHVLAELAKLADWYGFLKGGKIVLETSAKELDEHAKPVVEIEAKPMEKLVSYWDRNRMAYKALGADRWRVETNRPAGELALELAKAGIDVRSIQIVNEDLEAVYMQIMKGGTR